MFSTLAYEMDPKNQFFHATKIPVSYPMIIKLYSQFRQFWFRFLEGVNRRKKSSQDVKCSEKKNFSHFLNFQWLQYEFHQPNENRATEKVQKIISRIFKNYSAYSKQSHSVKKLHRVLETPRIQEFHGVQLSRVLHPQSSVLGHFYSVLFPHKNTKFSLWDQCKNFAFTVSFSLAASTLRYL